MPFSSFNFRSQRIQTTFSVIFSIRTCTAPHTRTCNFSDPGGLFAHGFQICEQEAPYQIDSRYLCPFPVSMLNLNGPRLHLFILSFFRYESALSHTHAHVTFRTLEVWLLTGFNFFEQETPHPIDSRYLCPSPVSMLNPNGLKLHIFRHFFG